MRCTHASGSPLSLLAAFDKAACDAPMWLACCKPPARLSTQRCTDGRARQRSTSSNRHASWPWIMMDATGGSVQVCPCLVVWRTRLPHTCRAPPAIRHTPTKTHPRIKPRAPSNHGRCWRGWVLDAAGCCWMLDAACCLLLAALCFVRPAGSCCDNPPELRGQ